jgi:hypothetical protein
MFHLRVSTTAILLVLATLVVILVGHAFRQPAPLLAQSERPATAVSLNDWSIYLPLVTVPPMAEDPYSNVITNGSFEAGWDPVAHGNQQPYGWTLSWLEPGDLLYDDDTAQATGTPEIVHKGPLQLPPDEQFGGANALVLDGEWTYKLFHANHAFGAELRQTVTGLVPGTWATLTVPVQMHWRPGDGGDIFAAEAGAWVNGEGQWANMSLLLDRQWYTLTIPFIVPIDGVAEVVIRVKSKWAVGKDFFIDDVRLMAVTP